MENIKHVKKRCFRCGGSGLIILSTALHKTCSSCKGKGYIKK